MKLRASTSLAPLAALLFVAPALHAQPAPENPAAPPALTPAPLPVGPGTSTLEPVPPATGAPITPAEPVPAPPAAPPPPSALLPSPPPSAPSAAVSGELPAAATSEPSKAASWFARPPLALSLGEGTRKYTLTFYGFVESDYIYDSTRSYGDAIGSSLVARTDTYAGHVGRSQFSMRNTRLGLSFAAPETDGVTPAAVIEGDFFGNEPSSSSSEAAFYGSPTFRVRQAYLTLKSDYVDVLAGQSYDVFGWQNYFFPCSLEFLGLPNQVFSRSTQLRVSHTFGLGPVALDLAVSAVRPVQRDSGTPDANAGLRLSVDSWKGVTTPGNIGTLALPASIGVSGTVRRFKVNAFTPPPAQRSNNVNGWGVSLDALLPVIPAKDDDDRGNKLTLTGSFVTGAGIGDLIGFDGGATFPTLPNPAQSNPPPLYTPDIDSGLVSFDTQGVLHAINWRAVRVGLQYYLPPTGRLIFAANYTESYSDNLSKLFPKGGAEIELLQRVANRSRYVDANLLFDVTPSVRVGALGGYSWVRYLDADKPHNLRGMAQALYAF